MAESNAPSLDDLDIPDDEEELQEWKEKQRDRLHADLDEHVAQEEGQKQKAIAALGEGVERYETLTLGSESFRVKSFMTGAMERMAHELEDAPKPDQPKVAANLMAELVKDGETIEGVRIDTADFWLDWYEEYGSGGLTSVLMDAMEIAHRGLEDVNEKAQKFRG